MTEGPKRKIFRPLESSSNHETISHETQATEAAAQDHLISDVFHFTHKARFQELRNQFLAIYLREHNNSGGRPNNPSGEVVSVYRVDLALLALGPVHHYAELKRASTSCFSSGPQQYLGRLNADIKFVQVSKIEIQLDSLDAKINMGLADAYQAGFSVVTQRDVNDSNKSYHCTRHVEKA